MTDPIFFPDARSFRAWLEANHATAAELGVGFRKKATGLPSITWPEARDEALCFGWIDGVRHRIDAETYRIRFTPRRAGSIWSKVNVERFHALKAAGKMTKAGAAVFTGKEDRTHYSYEKAPAALTEEEGALFRQNAAAWADWEKRPPGYRKVALHWVTSAKRPETRARRLATLIRDSAAGRKIGAVDIGRKRD